MIDPRLTPEFVRHLSHQFLVSLLLYTFALLIAFISPIACLAVTVCLTFLYLLPPKKPSYQDK